MKYINWIEDNRELIVNSVREIVRIRSVEDREIKMPDGQVLPFGRGVEEAYQTVLSMGEEMGFDTADFDHYGGHIEFKSSDPSAKTFGIAAHLDVVPEGKGWKNHEPYSADIEDGFIYGRGTKDDKGPLIACLYAMKAIKESGIKPKNNIRLILGLDEETNWIGMNYYLSKAGAPDFGITPDGDFPLINGEMGILDFDLAVKIKKTSDKSGVFLKKLQAGQAPNIVPDSARAVISSDDKDVYETIKNKAKLYSNKSGHELKINRAGTSLVVEAKGRASHGAKPWDGLNALSIMLEFLGEIQFTQDEVNDFISFYNDRIGYNLHGEKIGCEFSDEPSGRLIFNVGMAEFNQEIAQVTVNLRYPVTIKGSDVIEGIKETLYGTSIGFIKHGEQKPIHIEEDDPLVLNLMKAYVEETGDSVNKPLVIAGGTYAKSMDRMLAFGALFPGDEDRMHQANERLSIDNLIKYTKIYARAIYELACK